MAKAYFTVAYEDGKFFYDQSQQDKRFRNCSVYDRVGHSHTGWQWDRDYEDFRAEASAALSSLLATQGPS